jgi:hypothetical protein
MIRIKDVLHPTFLVFLICLPMLNIILGCTEKPPTIAKVEPMTGPTSGGTEITITGTGFKAHPDLYVKVGSFRATDIKVISMTCLKAVTPFGVAGDADIVVGTEKFTSVPFKGFKYYEDTPTTPDVSTDDVTTESSAEDIPIEKKNLYTGITFDYTDSPSFGVPSGWNIITPSRRTVSEGRLIKEENYKGTKVYVYKVEVFAKWEFDGGYPLNYELGVDQEKGIIIFTRFPGWIDEFEYGDRHQQYSGIGIGATARNSKGKVLATAKFQRYVPYEGSEQSAGIEMEENHLDSDRNVLFKCLSQYGFGAGFKLLEHVIQGNKNVEYFPVWPVTRISGD